MEKSNEKIAMGIILVGALIFGLGYFNIIPGLFTIASYTTYDGTCNSIALNATNGAVAGQCYSLVLDNSSQVMKVLSMQQIQNAGEGPTCRVDVIQASSSDACLNGKVLVSPGAQSDYCNSNADCPNTVCSSNICSTQQVVNCISFSYSNWSVCGFNNLQTRSILSSSPMGCSGGPSVSTQTCTYIAPSNQTNTNQNSTTTTTSQSSDFISKYLWYIIGAVILLIIVVVIKQ